MIELEDMGLNYLRFDLDYYFIIRQSFFTQRLVNDWNSLNGKVSTIDTIGGFKRFIDKMAPLVKMA